MEVLKDQGDIQDDTQGKEPAKVVGRHVQLVGSFHSGPRRTLPHVFVAHDFLYCTLEHQVSTGKIGNQNVSQALRPCKKVAWELVSSPDGGNHLCAICNIPRVQVSCSPNVRKLSFPETWWDMKISLRKKGIWCNNQHQFFQFSNFWSGASTARVIDVELLPSFKKWITRSVCLVWHNRSSRWQVFRSSMLLS